jgi:hypothetical protein
LLFFPIIAGLKPEFSSPHYPSVASVMQAWIEHLTITSSKEAKENGVNKFTHDHHKVLLEKFPPPADLGWIFCQWDACVLGKLEKSKKLFVSFVFLRS